MTQETEKEKRASILRKVFRVFFWPIRRWRNTAFALVVLAIAYIAIVQILQSQLHKQRKASRAPGEAMSLSDLQLSDLTEDKNAAVVYRQAHSQFRMPDGIDFDKNNVWNHYIASKTFESHQDGALTSAEEAMVDLYVSSNENAYKILLEARRKPLCQFGDYRDPMKVVFEKESFFCLDSVLPLTRSIATRAVWEARHGNTDVAYDWIGHGLHLANNMHNDPLLMWGLVRITAVKILLNALNTVMCETPWPGKLPDGFDQELIPLQERNLFPYSLAAERCFGEAGTWECDKMPRIIKIPIQICSCRVMSDIMTAARESDPRKRQALILEVKRKYPLPKGEMSIKSLHEGVQPDSLYDKIRGEINNTALLQYADSFDWSEAKVQNACQAIALKRYKQAHGQYPEQLQQCISDEFKELPLDPFNGEPFHYRKEGDGFLLYSVGANRVDDGGRVAQSVKDYDIVWRVTQ